MTIPNNPLRQFFRRPAVFLSLPSGKRYYKPGVIDETDTGELPVYPMTAIDEITARTPDALFNGEAMAQIIKSCVPSILQPWEINNIDLDAILIAIRTASGEGEMSMGSECPKCNELSDYKVELGKILAQLRCPNFDKTLDINELKLKFRPLTYREVNQLGLEQFNIQKLFANIDTIQDPKEKAEKTQLALKTVTDTTMKLVASAIEYIDVNGMQVENKDYIREFLENCDKNTYITIRDYTASLREEAQIKPLHMKCASCSHEYEQPFTLNLTDFFE
jgi:hypothetical protein